MRKAGARVTVGKAHVVTDAKGHLQLLLAINQVTAISYLRNFLPQPDH